MPVFKWSGRDNTGAMQNGEVEAANQAAATALLKQRNITPSALSEKKGFSMDKDMTIPGLEPKPTKKDLVIFTRQFATMIDAGLPLVQCLDILGSQQEKKTFKNIIFNVKEDVEGGATFADALSKHPKIFDALYVNLVAAGEVGGILDTILNRLAAYIEKAESLKSKVKGALVYPATIVGVAVVVTGILMVFVVPMFQEMFAGAGVALPVPTQILVNLSNFVKTKLYIAIIAGIVFVISFTYFYRTDLGNRIIDDLILKVPVFGSLLKKVAVARFTRTLGTMISSGVPIMDALEITAKTAGNKTVEIEVMATRTGISEGKTIAEPMSQSRVFPPMVVQMVAVGEATGNMDAMLNKIADFYDDEVDNAVAALTSLLEPMLMVFLGVVVGGMVIALYLPIFNMAAAMGGG
ncbi:MAG: type II secretion system F family protein [Deltaproteobacteria bacterium]|uniref:Type II secretion system F family protein n=1 Tax=Candidatus Zymogenus saltonus TaxID=2844893 RepID=A0A9D8KEP9_9DELT|nr:type II secretion system F family protein [Candidatus Zymogenus saltonus]